LLLGRSAALRRAGAFVAGFFIFSFATFLTDLLAAALDFARFVFFRITMLRSVHSVHARESGHQLLRLIASCAGPPLSRTNGLFIVPISCVARFAG
jgi:hypothetical protein